MYRMMTPLVVFSGGGLQLKVKFLEAFTTEYLKPVGAASGALEEGIREEDELEGKEVVGKQ